MVTRTVVAIVDDDESVRESLPDLLRELGFEARAFPSAEDFLQSDGLAEVGCLILDISLPGLTGPQLSGQLAGLGYSIPTFFITGRSEHSIPPDLVQLGEFECLFKPFSEQELSAALKRTLASGG